jgi:hypothetical protein
VRAERGNLVLDHAGPRSIRPHDVDHACVSPASDARERRSGVQERRRTCRSDDAKLQSFARSQETMMTQIKARIALTATMLAVAILSAADSALAHSAIEYGLMWP